MKAQLGPVWSLLLVAALVGAVVATAVAWSQASSARSDVRKVQQEMLAFTQANWKTVTIEPGDGDNAPAQWTGQQGEVHYALRSEVGFEFVLEASRLPPDRTFYVFFSPAPAGKNEYGKGTLVGQLKTDAAGRASLSGSIVLPPGAYTVGHFISDLNDAKPPFTNRTWLCFKQPEFIEVVGPQNISQKR